MGSGLKSNQIYIGSHKELSIFLVKASDFALDFRQRLHPPLPLEHVLSSATRQVSLASFGSLLDTYLAVHPDRQAYTFLTQLRPSKGHGSRTLEALKNKTRWPLSGP